VSGSQKPGDTLVTRAATEAVVRSLYVAYAANDIIWDKEFENVLSVEPDGRWVLDYRKFHDVRDAATTVPH